MAFEQFMGTRPVAPQHAFDEAALARWLRGHVEGFSGDLKVEQFKGGQSNPTFLLDCRQTPLRDAAQALRASCCLRPMRWTASSA